MHTEDVRDRRFVEHRDPRSFWAMLKRAQAERRAVDELFGDDPEQ
jgi:hypothetical protein